MTKRPCSPGLEALLGERQSVPIGPHAWVMVEEYSGTDQSIVRAARQSFDKRDDDRDGAGLINYLMRNHHTTPFEVCSITLVVSCPIFVARQWIRHRTFSFNEWSARYIELPLVFHKPAPEHMAGPPKSAKQGRGEALSAKNAADMIRYMVASCQYSGQTYEDLIGDGLAKELARTVLPLSTYTQFSMTVDLHNLLHFLTLRTDQHAQLEIRAYAEVIAGIVRAWVPETYAAWLNYRKHGVSLSRDAWAIIWKQLSDTRGIEADLQAAGISKSEMAAVMRLVRDEPV